MLYSLSLFNEWQEGFFIGLFESNEKAQQVAEHYLSAVPEARFVIAHEIGHYLFDFNEQTEAQFSHIFKEHYNKESQHDPNELRVNQFAACLLMPRSAFSESFEKLKSNPDLSLADIISTLAEQFAVTPKAATARIQELGLKVV